MPFGEIVEDFDSYSVVVHQIPIDRR